MLNKHIVDTFKKKTVINHGLQKHVIKATRWRIACAVLVMFSIYFYFILNKLVRKIEALETTRLVNVFKARNTLKFGTQF